MNHSGARFTFGCSLMNIQNLCKFCRSSKVHEFKLVDKTAGRLGLEMRVAD